MHKIIIIMAVLPSLLFIFGCSGDQDAVQKMPEDIEIQQEVSKIPTPAGTAEAIYVYPAGEKEPGHLSPAEFEQIYETISLKHIRAEKAAEILTKMMPESAFTAGNRSDLLIVRSKRGETMKVKKLVGSVDRPCPQIMIESRVVEISENALRNLGFTWGNGAGGFKFTVDTGSGKVSSGNIDIALNAMMTTGQARMIANPKIAALDNSEADVNIGSKIPYAVPVVSSSPVSQWAVQYIDAGVSLKITPHLSEGKRITVQIRPEVSSISEWRTTPAGEFPVISTRNAQSSVTVKDGQTIVIGGLIDEKDRENILKVPVAGEIPLIRELFTRRTTEKARTEIVFMITPHVL